MTKKAIGLVMKYALVVAIFYFIARLLWMQRGSLAGYFAGAGPMFYGSAAALAGFLLVQARIWTGLLNTPVRQMAAFRGTSVYINSQFAKYLPGAVWNLVGRMMLAGKHGATLAAQLKSIYYENVLLVSVAVVYGLLLFMRLNLIGWYAAFVAYIVVWLVYIYYNPVSRFTERLVKRYVQRFAEAKLFFSKRSFFAYFAIYLGSHMLMGFAFWLLLLSFGVRNIDLVEATGTFTLAWLLGLLSPLPGGIGLREGALVYLLSLQTDHDLAYRIAIVARVWSLLAELFTFAIVNATDYIGKRLKVSWM